MRHGLTHTTTGLVNGALYGSLHGLCGLRGLPGIAPRIDNFDDLGGFAYPEYLVKDDGVRNSESTAQGDLDMR